MSWRPEKIMWQEQKDMIVPTHRTDYSDMYESGADAMLESVLPLLKQVYAQLCGVRMKEGKTDWHSALDDSIERLKAIVPKINEETK